MSLHFRFIIFQKTICRVKLLRYLSTDYISELVKETVEVVKTGDTIVYSFDIPEPLASQYEKPQKSHAVQWHKTRFSLS